MGTSLRFDMRKNALKIMEIIFQAQTLDELWESCLTELIDIEHTRKVEVLLFNERNDLVPVADARQSRPRGEEKPVIRTQSWILESPVRHSTRKVKIPQVLPVLVVPLASADGLHGFMYIQWDRMPPVTPDWLNSFHSLGLYLGSKVKEIALKKVVNRLNAEIEALVSYNKENIQNISSLSKDFYAFSAISTKINQSLDLDKALRKSMAKIKEVYKSSSVAAYLKNSITERMELLVENPAEEPLLLFLRRSERGLLKDVLRSGRHLMTDPSLAGLPEAVDVSGNDLFKKIIVMPMKSRQKVLGALILLNRTDGVFTPENLRLLSGVANIMGMAIENMNLYRLSMQKKREGDFLIGSIAQFNKKLDLKKTLKSVVEKSTIFIEVHSHVFLFSETRFPLVEAQYKIQGKRPSFHFEALKKIPDSDLEAVYKFWAGTERPFLVRNLVRSRKLESPLRDFFQKKGIHSLMVIPLRLMEKQVGLLLLGSLKGQRAFVPNDLEVASALGAAAAVAIENARVHLASREMSEFLEKKIMEKTAQIQQIQERQKVRVENRDDLVFHVNKANRFVFVNRAMEVTSGYSREELYEGVVKAEDVICPEDRDRVREVFKSIMRAELPMIKDLEYRQINRLGDAHEISLTVFPEYDSSGRIVGLEGVGHDVTEQNRLKAEMEKVRNLALLGEFSGALAHQIRNPLGNILMGTKLLQRLLGLAGAAPVDTGNALGGIVSGKKNQDALEKVFSDLSQGINHLNQVVTSMLDYTKALQPHLSRQRLDLVLRESLDTFRDHLNKVGISVREHFDPQIPPLSFDAVLLGQVFQNVIDNAIQAMPKGGALSISSGIYLPQSNHILISVSDTGVGLDASELEKVFRPFYTTKQSGIGLGLSLAHRIIETHGGQIWACPHHLPTNPGETPQGAPNAATGLTIHILLPLAGNSQTDRVLKEQTL